MFASLRYVCTYTGEKSGQVTKQVSNKENKRVQRSFDYLLYVNSVLKGSAITSSSLAARITY